MNRSFHRCVAAGIAACVLICSAAVHASPLVIINDSFDGYADQAAFEAAWPVGAGTSGTLSTAQSFSSPNSIQNTAGGTHMNFQNVSIGGSDIIATDAAPLIWSFMFFDHADTSAGLGRSYGQLLGRTQTDTPALSQLLAMGLWNAGAIRASDGQTATVSDLHTYFAVRVAFSPGPNWIVLDTAPERSEGWHEMKAVIGSTTVEFIINGISGGTWDYATAEGNSGFYQARIGSGLSSSPETFFDNYYLAVVPLPGAVWAGMVLMGLMGGHRWLRRRRRDHAASDKP